MDELTRQHARALGAYMAARMSGEQGDEELSRLKEIENEIQSL